MSTQTIYSYADAHPIADRYSPESAAVVFQGDCQDLLRSIPDGAVQLVVTSPPYNIGKEYERRLDLNKYVEQQATVIRECHRILAPTGSICWQVGNYVDQGEIVPLDCLLYPTFQKLGMKMRNRIVWHFEHGLHCARRFSGRYETINWFTKSDDYYFELDEVRVPQKYPGKKHFKGPRAGEYSGNPLGKNPSDVWVIPNVKANHIEKTAHPCQFPVELIERLILSMTKPGDAVFDPFLGSGTTIVAAVKRERKGIGAEIDSGYCKISRERIQQMFSGELRTRSMETPVFDPANAGRSLTTSPWNSRAIDLQSRILERRKAYKS